MLPKRRRRRHRYQPRREGVVWDEVAPWDRTDWVILAAVTALALFLRLFRLEAMLEGLHHDEAITGLEAMRVLSDGYIGPYSASVGGQALGPAYWTALIFKLAEPSRFTLLLSMALLGAATIPVAYVLFRLSFGRGVALFGAVALSCSHWHLYYSRSGFMLAAMPLVTTLSATALLWVLRSPRDGLRWWLAGAALGMGVYSYTAYAGWIAIVAALLCCYALLERGRARLWAAGFALLAVGFATLAWPMVHYAILDTDVFLNRYLIAGVDPEKTLGYWAGRAWTVLALPFYHPARDAGTGFGGYGAMGWMLGPLAYAGLVICLRRWRSPPHLLLALAFVAGLGVLLLGVPGNGEYRRALLMVPFSFGMAGIAAMTLGRWAAARFWWRRSPSSVRPEPASSVRPEPVEGSKGSPRTGEKPHLPFALRWPPLSFAEGSKGGTVTTLVAAALLAVAAAENSWAYWADHRDIDRDFNSAEMAALDVAHAVDPGTIYWYATSEHVLAKQLFLYPETRLVDRYGTLDRLDDGPVTYVLRHQYVGLIDDLRKQQPGGEVTAEEHGRFVIYRLPAR